MHLKSLSSSSSSLFFSDLILERIRKHIKWHVAEQGNIKGKESGQMCYSKTC